MGIFTNGQKAAAENVYQKTKKFLEPQDGNTHVLMVNSFSKWSTKTFDCEDKYTTQLNIILSGMQKDGYKVIDVKFNSDKNQGLSGEAIGFHTLISYK